MTLFAVVILGVAGCSSTGVPSPSSSWSDPPWVAEQAVQREEYRSLLQSCLDSRGWHVTVNLDGGINEPFTRDEYPRFQTDYEACRVSMGLSPEGTPPTIEGLKVAYQELLDTRACLIAHGVGSMAAPPSEDAWIDAAQAGDSVWHPYTDPALTSLPEDQQDALEALCPQPWGTS